MTRPADFGRLLRADYARRGLDYDRIGAEAEARRTAALAAWTAEAQAAERHQCDDSCGIYPEPGCPVWGAPPRPRLAEELADLVRREVALALAEGLRDLVGEEVAKALAEAARKGVRRG